MAGIAQAMPKGGSKLMLETLKVMTDGVTNTADKNRDFFVNEAQKLLKLQSNNPAKAYKHNLEVTVAAIEGDIAATNMWDTGSGRFNKNFICDAKPGHPLPPPQNFLVGDLDKRPRIELTRPVENLHLRMVDRTTGKVHWDVVYDFNQQDESKPLEVEDGSVFGMVKSFLLGGTWKNTAAIPRFSDNIPFLGWVGRQRVGGVQQDFPPKDDPPHWYELTLTDEGAAPTRYNGGNFVGRVVLVENHPLDVPSAELAHKEGDVLEQAMPGSLMFAQS
eukprot:CAMPEP_0179005890 /NCGR_PEP_ID=MMETSP0795-20121207/14222_1 /TAXON_ID=88552 /ORGANISM="Amoebophrya sp., Strain Ameob2" /LENGTH=274 /DNA_ID=CAMNT_0020700535 /DNA_START=98 /DNA_END=925 /DNA_ORIENTATION=-